MLALDLRYDNDPSNGQNNNTPRWTQKCQDDWEDLRPCHSTNWGLLQLVPDMWQHDISLPWRCLHPDAEGKMYTVRTLGYLGLLKIRQLRLLPSYSQDGALAPRNLT